MASPERQTSSFEVFISHAGDGGMKTVLALPLKAMFASIGRSAFVDEPDLKPSLSGAEGVAGAVESCEVFLALVDNVHYPRSLFCMGELRQALHRSSRCRIFPVFLSRTDQYPADVSASKALIPDDLFDAQWTREGWTRESFVETMNALQGVTGLRACEDKTFQAAFIIVSVDALIETGEALGLQDMLKPEVEEKIKKVKAACSGEASHLSVSELTVQKKVHSSPHAVIRNTASIHVEHGVQCIGRSGHTFHGTQASSNVISRRRLRKCQPPPLDSKWVALHATEYGQIKSAVLSGASATATTIAGVGINAHGGVGKTWIALRLAHDEEVRVSFPGGILWSSFGKDKVAYNGFEALWFDLGGAELQPAQFEVKHKLAMFREVLAKDTSRTLIILDDIWHEEHLKIFKDVSQDFPQLRVLITTRLGGVISTVFGKDHSIVISLSAKLKEKEAFELMQRYAEWVGSIEEDRESMRGIAKLYGFHPKALAVISTQANESWASLLDLVSQQGHDKLKDAATYVFNAVSDVFKFQTQHTGLMDQFCALGLLRDDTLFCTEDIAIVLDEQVSRIRSVIDVLVKCSLLERRCEPIATMDPVYYLHHLMRDYARAHGKTRQMKQRFVKAMCKVTKDDTARVTPYIFENLGAHIGRRLWSLQYWYFKLWVKPKFRNIVHSAANGSVPRQYHRNMYVMAIAFACRPAIAEEMDLEAKQLLLTNPDFFAKALSVEPATELNLSSKASWFKIEPMQSAFCTALKSNTTLLMLDLSHNEIGDLGAVALGESLNKNTALQSLKLSGTLLRVKNLKDGPETIDLSFIGLWDIDAIVIAHLIAENVSLTVLSLSRNQIGDAGAKALSKALQVKKSLTELNLWNNKIGDDGAKALGQALQVNKSMLKLNLAGNRIGDDGAEALGDGLKVHKSLSVLSLQRNRISDPGAQAIGKGLAQNTSLKMLDLEANRVGYHGAKALSDGLEDNTSLTFLKFGANLIGPNGAESLGGALKVNNTLQTLDSSGNKIGDDGAKALSDGLKENKSLTELGLYRNKIGDKGAVALGDALKENRVLTNLDLAVNRIGSIGARALSDMLKENESLTSLNFSGTGLPVQKLKGGQDNIGLADERLRDIDAIVIANLIAENPSLTTLRLEANKIEDDGAKALGDALRKNSSLTELNLAGNKIGDSGAEALVQAIEKNKTLTGLDLRLNKIRDEGAKALADVLKQNESLTKLSLAYNDIDDDGAITIGEALRDNKQLQVLDIVGNTIGTASSEVFLEVLANNDSLQEINGMVITELTGAKASKEVDLAFTGLRDFDAALLSTWISNNTTLESLNLSNNNIEDAGATAIGKALEFSKALQVLRLSNNQIGDDGAKALGDGLKKSGSLNVLFLNGNKIGDIGAQALGEGLAQNNALTELILYDNTIGGDGAKGLADGLAKNKALQTLNLYNNAITEKKQAQLRTDKRIRA